MEHEDGMARCIDTLMAALEGVTPSAQVWVKCIQIAYTRGYSDATRNATRQMREARSYTDAEVVA